MGTASVAFQWASINPDQTVGVFLHPFSTTAFTGFCVRVGLASNEPPGAYTSIAAQLTDGPTNLFFGSIARTLWVHNQTIGPQPYIAVDLIAFEQEV